jgi:hypothetical protein
MKTYSQCQPRPRTWLNDSLKEEVRKHYHSLLIEWRRALQQEPTDWARLLKLHRNLALLERHSWIMEVA